MVRKEIKTSIIINHIINLSMIINYNNTYWHTLPVFHNTNDSRFYLVFSVFIYFVTSFSSFRFRFTFRSYRLNFYSKISFKMLPIINCNMLYTGWSIWRIFVSFESKVIDVLFLIYINTIKDATINTIKKIHIVWNFKKMTLKKILIRVIGLLISFKSGENNFFHRHNLERYLG